MVRIHLNAGERYGSVVVIEYSHKIDNRFIYKCLCDCGNYCEIDSHRIRREAPRGKQSCGCKNKHKKTSYPGGSARRRYPEYTIWRDIIRRCTNSKRDDYKHYGGRGITISPLWRHDFLTFLKDVGQRPSPQHSIDRKDNDGNYEPGNVRWATRYEQQANTRQCRLLTLNGETHNMTQWERIVNIPRKTISQRLKAGLTVEQALTLPLYTTYRGKIKRA